jgi:protein-L-isoaspartate O-methyltransferase
MARPVRPVVTVEGGPTLVPTSSAEDDLAAAEIFAVQWRYVHGTASADELLPYTGVIVAGRVVETDPDVLDEWARRGDFDITEVYRVMFG